MVADRSLRTVYRLADLRRDLRRDIEIYLDHASAGGRRSRLKRVSALLTPSVTACLLYRLSHCFHTRQWTRIALALAWGNFLLTKVSIYPASEIGGGMYIPHPGTCTVFEGRAGRNLRLFAGSAVSAEPCAPLHRHALTDAPCLGDDVMLGSKAFVLGPVEIGDGCSIGINAIVRRHLPAGATAMAARRNTVRHRDRAAESADSD